jgi:hypothetical protein
MRRKLPIALILVTGSSFAILLGGLEHRRRERALAVADMRVERDRFIRARQKAERDQAAAVQIAAQNAVEQSAAIEHARQEVAALEHHALERHAEILAASQRRMAEANQPANGRDPEQGMTKLEYFQNVGRDTPAHALQTIVWAAMKGDEPTLNGGLALDERALERAKVLISRLPETARNQMSPEKLAALWFEGTVLDVPAAQILRQELKDDTHAMLLMRGDIADASTLRFIRDSTGWQLVVPQHGLEVVQKKVIGSSSPLP